MNTLSLRNINFNDKQFFAIWWRDNELISLTSGCHDDITDDEIDKYFQAILNNDINKMIMVNNAVVGHVSLSKREKGWFELQIIIGEKDYWDQGVGSAAVNLLLENEISKQRKIYLEVRPDNLRAIKSYEKCGFKSQRIVYYPNNPNLSKVLRMELCS